MDEVHERNLDADFLLLLARRMMLEERQAQGGGKGCVFFLGGWGEICERLYVHTRMSDDDVLLFGWLDNDKYTPYPNSGRPPLRLILMSATMDAAKVARYFQACNLPVATVSASGMIINICMYIYICV